MNKVFLDPNTKYSDQYAMLAKLPEVVDVVNETAEKVEDIPEIPAPAVADIGKVLGVVSDGESGAEYGAVEQSGGLPAIESGDAGKVLTVNAGETGAEWDSVDALPAIESGDAGKVLTVNAGETAAEWASVGSNSPMIVHSTFNPTDEYYHLDKTYGEIRAAFNAGQTVLITYDGSGTFEYHHVSIVQQCNYTIGNNPEYPEATGAVVISNEQFNVRCESAPYTLAALDALYPVG